jgi:2-polyprenyl-3-methyl-5-hydroxy-6-metoxy-1,4-benzoquinol methylase
MATASHGAKPSPERIFATLTAYQQTEALKAAIDLDIFTHIAEGANEAASLAKAIGGSQRGIRILCDYMVIQGFLSKDDGKYSLPQDSAIFLSKKSPAYMGAMANFLASPMHRESFGVLAASAKKGGCAVVDKGDNSKPNDEFWVKFAQSMAGLAVPSAEFIAAIIGSAEGKPVKVLDIAAGHGMFGITIAKRNPNAQIVALDWPAVLEVAKENANKAGVVDRLTAKPGSAFETEYGEGYDYVLLTNILHHFSPADCEKMLRRVHKALKPGGKTITLEFVPNEDRVTPPLAAAFSIVMLANTNEGEAHTFADHERMARNAGFRKSTLQQVPDMPQQLVISEK